MITRIRPPERVKEVAAKGKQRSRKLVGKLPGEFLHRAASFVIICEALFHTFNRLLPIGIAAVAFVAIEILGGNSEEI